MKTANIEQVIKWATAQFDEEQLEVLFNAEQELEQLKENVCKCKESAQ